MMRVRNSARCSVSSISRSKLSCRGFLSFLRVRSVLAMPCRYSAALLGGR